MTRVTNGMVSHARQKKILKLAKGYRGRSSSCYRLAKQRVEKALQYAYRDRKKRKSNFRSLWIQRINAAARLNGLTYATFMNGINKAGLGIDRKIIADLAVKDAEGFKSLAKLSNLALQNPS